MVLTQNQRLEGAEGDIAELKEQMSSLHTSIAEQVTNAVQVALTSLQQTLAEQIATNLENAAKKPSEELAANTMRLEGRIDRTRENHEVAIEMMKQDQEKFQAEMRIVVNELKGAQSQNSPTGQMGMQGNPVGNLTIGRVGFNVQNENLGQRTVGSIDGPNAGNGGSGDRTPVGDPGGGYNGPWRQKKLDLLVLTGVTRMGGSYERRGSFDSIG